MAEDVPFSEVLEFFEEHDYQLLRRRTSSGDGSVGFAVFARAESPNIGVEIRNKMVANEHFQKIIQIVESLDDTPPTEV